MKSQSSLQHKLLAVVYSSFTKSTHASLVKTLKFLLEPLYKSAPNIQNPRLYTSKTFNLTHSPSILVPSPDSIQHSVRHTHYVLQNTAHAGSHLINSIMPLLHVSQVSMTAVVADWSKHLSCQVVTTTANKAHDITPLTLRCGWPTHTYIRQGALEGNRE